MGSNPRLLFIDIETSPIIAAVWNLYEANAVWVERDTFILCFAAKWSDEKVQTYALPDYKGYKKNNHCDKHLVLTLWKLLNAADIVVAHNGDSFDIKKINSRFAVHGLPPPSPYRTIDTLKIARGVFKFDSNKLDNLGRYLKEGRKLPNTGAILWRGCVNGCKKSWGKMRRYNAQDVLLLERVFERLKPWAKRLPDITGTGCPSCNSTHVQRRGLLSVKSRKHRYECRSCGHWFSR